MTAFNLWNPALLGPKRLRVTENEGSMGAGTDLLVSTICVECGAGTATSWTLEAVRTGYFTDYPDPEEAWEDRWALAWALTVELASARRALLPVPLVGRFAIDAEGGRRDAARHSPIRCLVIADARTEADAERLAALVPAHYAVERSRSLGALPSLLIDLGARDDAFFEAGAEDAVALMATLADAGASVHRSTSFNLR